MYKVLIKPLLFLLSPEKAHHFTFTMVKWGFKIPGVKAIVRSIYAVEDSRLERTICGLRFKNPVGLAAGFDKDAKLFNELGAFGFGFVEIGTVTPLGQPGNEQPRLFRLPVDEALINRMGFNNHGAEMAAQRLKTRNSHVIIGGNIGKNKITPNEDATQDYIKCFNALYPYVDYFVVNVSSPNTPNLRALQEKEPLKALLGELMVLNKTKPQPKPVFLKIAPDLTNEQLDDIIEIVQETRIDGVIATNTTISRSGLNTPQARIAEIGAGGLSGKILKDRATEVIRYLHTKSDAAFPIIGVGGIHSAEDALEKLAAGASLVQLYTGFIYDGPVLIKQINKALLKK